ncbi:MAG: YihY/virulence factor BrkB family protein [Acidimicrobiales bacterium]|jgi:YihY family inner membrane protein
MTGAAGTESPGPGAGRRGILARVDAYQQRHRVTAVVAATVVKYGEDGAGRLADLLAYGAFLAVFPMLLILLTLVEVLLFGHPAIQKDVVDAALRQFPDVGDELRDNITGLSGRNVVLLAVLLLWLVYGCLRLSRSAQGMMAAVWAVPRAQLPRFGRWLPRAVGFLAVIGAGFVAGGAIAGIGSFGGLGPASPAVGFVGSLVVNVAMFWAGFAVLVAVPDARRTLWRGAVVAGVGWTVLQFVDAQLVTHELRHYHTLYGTFATFVVLLWWIGIGTVITTFAAEIDVVVARHLWPRSIRRRGPRDTSAGSSVDQSTSAGVVD